MKRFVLCVGFSLVVLLQSLESFPSSSTLNSNANEKSDQSNDGESRLKRFYKKVMQKIDGATVLTSMVTSGIVSFLMIKSTMNQGVPVSSQYRDPVHTEQPILAPEARVEESYWGRLVTWLGLRSGGGSMFYNADGTPREECLHSTM